MKNTEVLCEQPKAFKAKILVILVFVLGCLVFLSGEAAWHETVLMGLPAFLFFSYKRTYHISTAFKNYAVISFIGIPIVKTKLKLEYPDYISVFSTSCSQSNEWSTVSALGSKQDMDFIVIRFFKGNKHFTVYRTKVYENAKEIADQLKTLLKVEVYDRTTE